MLLSDVIQSRLIQFLQSLVPFPPDDMSSNLNPAEPNTTGYPQFGHGSFNLGLLFNDPNDKE